MSNRKVIAQISVYERKPRRHPVVGFYMHRVSERKIFDSYEDFEAYRQQIREANQDRMRETGMMVDWWWWCD